MAETSAPVPSLRPWCLVALGILGFGLWLPLATHVVLRLWAQTAPNVERALPQTGPEGPPRTAPMLQASGEGLPPVPTVVPDRWSHCEIMQLLQVVQEEVRSDPDALGYAPVLATQNWLAVQHLLTTVRDGPRYTLPATEDTPARQGSRIEVLCGAHAWPSVAVIGAALQGPYGPPAFNR